MPSVWQDVGVGAAQGGGTGFLAGGPIGAGIGAFIGGASGFFSGKAKDKARKRDIKYQKAIAKHRIAAAQSQLADFDEASTYRRQGIIGRGLGDSSVARRNVERTARQRALYSSQVDLANKAYQLARKGRLAEERVGYINLLDGALQGIAAGVTGYATGWNPNTMTYNRGAGQFNYRPVNANPF